MRGLPKIRRKGSDLPASEQPTQVAAPISPDDQPTAAYSAPLVSPVEQPTAEQTAIITPPPADLDPAAMQVAPAPSFRDRGRLRRRLVYLRRVRELGFRDLGGLVFDLHRFQRPGQHLVDAKLNALAIVDRELRALERVLKDKPLYIDLREPGIAACPRCAALHGSDARFCPSCGIKLSGPLGIGEVGGVAAPPPPPSPAAPSPPSPAAPSPVTQPTVPATPVVEPTVPVTPVAEPPPPAPQRDAQPQPEATTDPVAPTEPPPDVEHPASETAAEPQPEAAVAEPPAKKGRARRGRPKAKTAPADAAPAATEPDLAAQTPEPADAPAAPDAQPAAPAPATDPQPAEPEQAGAGEPEEPANPWTPPGTEPRP